jgi:putative transposase
MNKRHNRVGTLFLGRFKTAHIDGDEYLLHLSRYIHLNPVKASFVKLPEDWQFSSYLEFIGKRQGSLPKPSIILRQFSSIDEYRAFVESGINVEDKMIDHIVLEN